MESTSHREDVKMENTSHREERSDVAIQLTPLPRRAPPAPCHREERSDVAIHLPPPARFAP